VSPSWATSGLDLHLDMTGRGVRAGVEHALREAVRSGRLGPGTVLPSSRGLAGDLGVARNTVATAYAQLVAEGWLVARQGSRTRVGDRAPAAVLAAAPTPSPARPPPFDLRAGAPDLGSFPRTLWLGATRRALRVAAAADLGYPDPRGVAPLREALAGYLTRARGVQASPERVVVCSGFGHGLALLARMLHARGGRVLAAESHGLTDLLQTATTTGFDVSTLPVDHDGAVVDDLGGQAAVLLTPAHQFPLGVVLGPQRRSQVVQWARDSGALVIEDDYDGEFRYDRHPVGALQALAPEHVIYAGTASKTLAPGLRLGWLVLPAHLVEEVTALLADTTVSTLGQLALAELITSGGYDRHVRRQRLAYRHRRDHLIAAVQQIPGVQVTGVAAGLHLVLRLPSGTTEHGAIDRCRDAGVTVRGLTTYQLGSHIQPAALVIGYATPAAHAFRPATTALTTALTTRPPQARHHQPTPRS